MIDIHYHDACPDELFDEYGESVDLELLAQESERQRDKYLEESREWAEWSERQRGY